MIKRLADFIAGHPKLIVILAVALLVPSLFGYLATFVNYDILSYLPKDLNSVQGEQILDETFHNAASSFIVIENTQQKDCAELKAKIEQVDGVNAVLWVDSLADISIPQSILPEELTDVFYSQDGTSTMMMVQYKQSGSSDETMNAINAIKGLLNKNCFVSGLSAIAVETKELADKEAPVYIGVAIGVALLIMMFTMQSYLQPFLLLTALLFAVAYNMGSNIMFGSISYITQCIGAILQLGVTMDYSVFLIDRYEEELRYSPDNRKEAMSRAIVGTFTSLAGSSLTTVFGFLALCFMSFTLGADIGLVMMKGVL
ncbi:MAG TPA: antibiotic ABC transporter permease, partial [Ruminococcaceae bacterium]|nr:antibiotic ABC transporter permease [Oscillospiraceae bacterium]